MIYLHHGIDVCHVAIALQWADAAFVILTEILGPVDISALISL